MSEIENRSILKHPFYQSWNEGKLSRDALRVYAKQYYRFVALFPHLLERIIVSCEDPETRQKIQENLSDEEKHPAFWLNFAHSLELTDEELTGSELLPETQDSLQTMQSLAAGTLGEAAAAMLAYEAQVPEVSRQKKEGLKRHYNIGDAEALEFFNVHTQIDLEHVKIWERILSQATPSEEAGLLRAVRLSLEAQWKLLDGVLRDCKTSISTPDMHSN